MQGLTNLGRFGGLSTATTVVSGLILLAIVLMVGSFAYVNYYGDFDAEYIERSEAVRVLGQRIAKNASEAANGKTDAFFNLRESRDELQRNIDALVSGNPQTGLPPTGQASASAEGALQRVLQPWNEIGGGVQTILDNQERVIAINELAEEFRGTIPRIQLLTEESASRLAAVDADQEQVLVASRSLLYADQITRNIEEMLRGGIGNRTAAARLEQASQSLGESFDSLLGDGPLDVQPVVDAQARESLQEGARLFSRVEEQVAGILGERIELFEVREAADRIFTDSDRLEATTDQLLVEYRGLSEARPVKWWFGFAFGLLVLILLVIRGFLTRIVARAEVEAQREEKRKADEQSKKNQQAILDLLDEIQGLSEGDLTVQASVGEEFTGAIGDAFNDAIDALRSLVTTINETSVQVSSAAQETQATAMHLAEASDHQAHQITAASAAINEMAVSIDQVSRNSEESTEVARRSVDLAHKGADTVRRTIDGMDVIREQIQETSKRIKRLGESSQEIGNIVELINDIADQTNILALNASIQAAMAGEAGRGFAVVADEVQRLAERSGNATKQIEALVKTIQTDTNEAVISMEQSTTGVVSGARLAEDAGDALREIETTSQQLAGLIQNISGAARQQAKAAANISDTMNVIQEITSQTSAGTNETATSIGNLADLANDLRNSVAGFKLPE